MIILKKYPLPPTSNNLYSSVNGRLIKSKIARLYEFEVFNYSLRNINLINKIKNDFINCELKIDTYFIFNKKRLISKENNLKKIDASNRIKACHDSLSKITGIDDKNIISGHFEKVYCNDDFEEQVIIVIKKENIKNYKNLNLG